MERNEAEQKLLEWKRKVEKEDKGNRWVNKSYMKNKELGKKKSGKERSGETYRD